MNETWKIIPDFDDYAVSDFGNVKRITFTKNNQKPKQLKPRTDRYGYKQVTLTKEGQRFYKTVHSLVVLAFIGNRPLKNEVNHLNGKRNDNRLINLEYVTSSENKLHAYKTGLTAKPIGEKNGNAKLTARQVTDIKRRLAKGETQSHLSREYGVTFMAISFIKQGVNWRHIRI